MMKLALGCDHGGFPLMEAVRRYLSEKHIEVEDFGCFSTESVDYAPIAAKTARAVAEGQTDYGVLICTTGLGVSMAANKVKGIRAAVCTNELSAEMTRRHNNANVLCMGARMVDESAALRMLDIFLGTPFEGGRHQRRIDQIAQIEEGTL